MATTGDGTYPFAGIVGMADLKLALLLNAVSPAIGGVLVRGEKGTAKSTMVRGLAALLPPVPVVPGCPYSCDPAAPDPACPAGPHPSAAAPDPAGPHQSAPAPDPAGPHQSAPGASAARESGATAPHQSAATEVRPVTLAELPVGATEDRLTGSLDIERVLTAGTTAFQPGLLAAANRGILYVDEVNLLHDHLVDLLLDAAALGVNYVEREGVSVRHSSRFILVGTMNPEEGELRPQLLDRFGLTVQVTSSHDPAERAEVVRRRLAFEADPAAFAERFTGDGAALADQVVAARARLPKVRLPDAVLRQICAVCGAFGVDGMRADLVTARTAIALAAWHGRDVVTAEDVRAAARLALPHRRRRDPFDAPGLDEQALDEALQQAAADQDPDDPDDPGDPQDPGASNSPENPDGPEDPDDDPNGPGGPGSPAPSEAHDHPDGHSDPNDPGTPPVGDAPSPGHPSWATGTPEAPAGAPAAPSAPFRARMLTVPGIGEGAPGRRSAARGPSGRTVAARVPQARPFPLHLPATIRAAALHAPGTAPTPSTSAPGAAPSTSAPGAAPTPSASAPARGASPPASGAATAFVASPPRRTPAKRVPLTPADLREAVREGREGNLVLFAVDASGSMAARQRMREVKGAVLSLLVDAYQRRDKVGLITFRGARAEVTLPPTSSVEAAARRLTDLATGGRTPLAAGLAKAAQVLAAERLRDPRRRALLIVVTDGRATSGTDADLARTAAVLATRSLRDEVATVVVDCEASVLRLGLAERLAIMLGATLFRLDELAAGSGLAAAARQMTQGQMTRGQMTHPRVA
jgi:magnesium chelatase subunit D